VRQALNMSFSRADTVVAKYGPKSGAKVTSTPILKGSPAYTPGLDVKYNPAKSKSLLAEAGLSDVPVDVCGLPVDSQEIEVARTQAAKAGFVFKVDIQPSVATCIEGIGNGTYGVFWIGWSGRPDPYMTYAQLAGPNYQTGDYHFPDIFALLDKALATTDKAELSEIYAGVNKLWVEQVPQIVTYFNPNIAVYSNDLTGTASTQRGRNDVTTHAPAK
jgi:ABC-type transport system substrate-binding protein